LRYSFFEDVRKKHAFNLIAVAHNADDQVETYLMRVIRGAGLKGLSAMKYKSDKIIRPLLNVSRKEILEYLKTNNLKFRTDKTNAQNLFFRNKIRNKLIPYLQKNFNPNIKKTILDSVASIAEDADFISKEAEKKKTASVKKILALHTALQKRIILREIGKIKPDLKDIEAAHVSEILKSLKSTKGKNQIVVFKGLKIVKKGDKISILCNL